MKWAVIHPEQVIALRDDPHFVSAEQYPADIELVHGELGCLLRADRVPLVRFVVQETVLPASVMVSDHRPRTTMVVPLYGMPEVPELWRPALGALRPICLRFTPIASAVKEACG